MIDLIDRLAETRTLNDAELLTLISVLRNCK